MRSTQGHGLFSFLRRKRPSALRGRRQRALGAVEALEPRRLLAGTIIQLGPQTGFMDQPYVDIELFTGNGPGSISLGPHDSGWGIYPYNHLLLDTGANSAMVVSDAAAELEDDPYYVVEGTYHELGVAGYTEFDVSAPYRLDFRGTDGIPQTLWQTENDVRILSSSELDLGLLPASEGGLPGVLGMPAMVDRITTLDMSQWIGVTDFFELEPMGVTFPADVPASAGHRYSVPVDTRVTFDPHDGLPEGSPPDAPLPVWAPVPFLTAVVQYGGLSRAASFLLDTGSQMTVISRSLAFAIGLDEDGDGTFDAELHDTIDVGGVGGIVSAPVLWVDQVRLPTLEGQDLVWRATAPEDFGIEVLVLDIAEGIDGVLGVDLLTGGMGIDLATLELVGEPYFAQIHFDFRDLDTGSGTLFFDVNPTYAQVVPEPPGFRMTQSDDGTAVVEGGATDTYQIVLTAAPTANVVVTVTPDSQLQVDQTALTFTPANWNTPQTVTVTAIDDGVREGPHRGRIMHTVASADPRYHQMYLATLDVQIDENTPTNQPPVAVPGGPYVVDIGAGLTLDGSGSYDPDEALGDRIVQYAWDLDADGQFDDAFGPRPVLDWAVLESLGLAGPANPATGLPSNAIALQVTDTFSATHTASTTLTLYDNRPVAAFTASPNPAAPTQTITFNASTSTHGRPDRHIVSYYWDFGDGATVTTTTPITTHAYSRFGSYEAVLTVTDDNVPAKTASTQVTVNVNQGNRAPSANAGGPYAINAGQGVMLDARASSDPDTSWGDRIVSYAWELNGDGRYDDLVTSEPTVVAPWSMLRRLAQPNVANPIGLRVTDTFGAKGTATTTLTIAAAPLGAIDSKTLAGLDPANGDLWYVFQTTHQGTVTVDATYVGPTYTVGLSLYQNPAQAPLAVSTGSSGYQRVDWPTAAGVTYYLKVSGTAGSTNLRLVNLLERTGTTVTVAGTAGEDTFGFDATSGRKVTINGVVYNYTAAEVTSVTFDGGDGGDTATLIGSPGNDMAILYPFSGTLQGLGYLVTLANVSHKIVYAGDGVKDVAKLSGSNQNDTFTAGPASGIITGKGFSSQGIGFDQLLAYARVGTDTAVFDGSSGADVFNGKPTYSYLSGPGFYLGAQDFDEVTAHSTPGSGDIAHLNDSSGDETFTATLSEARMTGLGFQYTATSFDNVYGYARNGGTDRAELFDGSGDDTFDAWPEYAVLSGPGIYRMVKSFDEVKAYGTGGGSNVANFYDTTSNDTFIARLAETKMITYRCTNIAVQFATARAFGYQGGVDTAHLYDSPNNDSFVATPVYGKLSCRTYYRMAKQFDYVYAHSEVGGTDTAYFYDSPGNDTFTGTPGESVLSGPGFYLSAAGFAAVYADGTAGGFDVATLNDTPGNDHLEAAGNWVRLSQNVGALDLLYEVAAFESVTARRTTGIDTKNIAPEVTFLQLAGGW